jgi:CcmD family protein
MSAFVTTYLVVWFAVLGYLLRLASRQRRLEEAVESLDRRLRQPQQPPEQAASRAA